MSLCRSALLACVLLAVAPTAASAADVSISGATLSFAAADGENNAVTVSLAAGTYTLADAGAPVTPGAGCSAGGGNAVTCPSAGITALTIDGRDLDDTITVGGGERQCGAGDRDVGRRSGGGGDCEQDAGQECGTTQRHVTRVIDRTCVDLMAAERSTHVLDTCSIA